MSKFASAWLLHTVYNSNLLHVLTLYNRSICLHSYKYYNKAVCRQGMKRLILTCFWGGSVCMLSTMVRVITASTECLISAAIIFSSIKALLVGFGENRLNRGHERQKPFVNWVEPSSLFKWERSKRFQSLYCKCTHEVFSERKRKKTREMSARGMKWEKWHNIASACYSILKSSDLTDFL